MVGDQQTHIIPAEPRRARPRRAAVAASPTPMLSAMRCSRGSSVWRRHYGALFEKIPPAARLRPEDRRAWRRGRPGRPCRRWSASASAIPERPLPPSALGSRAAMPRRAARRARERLTEFLPSSARCLQPHGRARPCLVDLRQGHGQYASGPASCSRCLPPIPACCGWWPTSWVRRRGLPQILGRRPRLLDAVLDPGFFGAVPTPAQAEGAGRGGACARRPTIRMRSIVHASSGASRASLLVSG